MQFFYKIIIVLLILINPLLSIVPPTRDIILLFETGRDENLQLTVNEIESPTAKGFGAISSFFLTSLYQEPSPIITTKNRALNIYQHALLLNDIISLDYSNFT